MKEGIIRKARIHLLINYGHIGGNSKAMKLVLSREDGHM